MMGHPAAFMYATIYLRMVTNNFPHGRHFTYHAALTEPLTASNHCIHIKFCTDAHVYGEKTQKQR